MKLLKVTLAWLCTLTLAACTSLPTTGNPQAFDVDLPTPSAVDFVAGAPPKGASPEALIEAFLRACAAGTSDNFETAKLFLTRQSARTWKPENSIHIYSTDATPLVRADMNAASPHVLISAPAVATVDNTGMLNEVPAGQSVQMRYDVVQEKGEWRISNPENAVIISEASFQATYQLSHVFFRDSTGDSFISEPRWFAQKHLARHLMKSLLAGPSDQLKSVARTEIPPLMRLAASGVEVREGHADVWLEGPLTTSDSSQMVHQITLTMRQSAQVRDVTVYVNGNALERVKDAPAAPVLFDSAVAMSLSGMGVLTNGHFFPLQGDIPLRSASANVGSALLSGRWSGDLRPRPQDLVAMHPQDPAVVAWVGEGQLTVLDRESGRSHRVGAVQPSWPSVDRFGWAWTVAHGHALTVASVAGQSRALAAASVPSGVVNIRISPDGHRALMVRRLGETDSVWVGFVVRDRQGGPVRLVNVYPLPRVVSGVLDVSWASSSTVVVLQGSDGVESVLWTMPLGGMSSAVAAPVGARFVTVGGSGPTVYVTDGRGQVWVRANALWQPIEDDVVSVRFPG